MVDDGGLAGAAKEDGAAIGGRPGDGLRGGDADAVFALPAQQRHLALAGQQDRARRIGGRRPRPARGGRL
jgi:hypothetical protein